LLNAKNAFGLAFPKPIAIKTALETCHLRQKKHNKYRSAANAPIAPALRCD
jgi:hypothetical protein